MPWAETSSFPDRRAFRDPWILGNLLLRAGLLALALHSGGFMEGDSGGYVLNAGLIRAGEWGGTLDRTPLYVWLLSAFSFGPMIPLILGFQSLALWLLGVRLYRRERRLASMAWLFDPVLLAYGNIVMTDALFAVAVLALALAFHAGLKSGRFRAWAWIGSWSAVVILLRPIGIPLIELTFALLALLAIKGLVRGSRVVAAGAVLLALLAPRLAWDYQKTGRFTLAEQGSGWIRSVAAAVEDRGLGLGFYETEIRWNREHPKPGISEAIRALLDHWPAWAWLSLKGSARVAVGHVNTEWAALITGTRPAGPGWFKEGSPPPNTWVMRGPWLAAWTFGLLATAGFCLWVYWRLGTGLFSVFRALDAQSKVFFLWACGAMGVLAAVPQVFGDARFRAPVWSLVIACIYFLPGRPARPT